MNEKIIAHHVGARGFGVPFNPPYPFRDDVVHVLHEADVDCAQEMIAANSAPNVKVLAYCLGEADYESTLKVTRNPYFSSLRRPNQRFLRNTCEVELSGEIDDVPVAGVLYDAIYADEMAVEKEIPVKVRSVDSLLSSHDLPEELSPDFISLDTQGTEFEVLQGASSTIKQSVLAIVSEVEFTPMYDGQSLFGELFDFVRRQNFEFGGFQYLQDILPCHFSVGLRSHGFLGFGDCIFFRDLGEIRERFGNGLEFAVAGAKLTFIAFNFGYSSFAIAAARAAMAAEISETDRGLLKRRTYFRFAEEVDAATREMPERYLHTSRQQLVAQRRVAIAQRQAALMAKVRSLIEDAKTLTDRECSAAARAAEKVAEARRFVGALRIYQVNEIALLRRVAQEAIAQAVSAERSAASAREEAERVSRALALLDKANGPDAAELLRAMVQEVEQAASTAAGFADSAQNSAKELIREPIVRVLRALRAPVRVAARWKTSHREAPGTSYTKHSCDNGTTDALISAEGLFGLSVEEAAVPDDKGSEGSALVGSDEVNEISPVESVLARYGFETASAELRRRRCAAAPYVRPSR